MFGLFVMLRLFERGSAILRRAGCFAERLLGYDAAFKRRPIFLRTASPIGSQADDSGSHRPNHRQKFVNGQFHQHVVILWLTAAPDALLIEPVAERTDHARHDPLWVGEDRRVEE